MKNKKILELIVIVIVISFGLTTVISTTTLNNVIRLNNQDTTLMLSSKIYDMIDRELSDPIMVAKTMANNTFLKRQLMQERTMSLEEMDSTMTLYLNNIRTNLGYNSTFVVSDYSNIYYTHIGYNKTISPQADEHDTWYTEFVSSGKEYDFDVDMDEVNDGTWTIFVNSRIEDNLGNLQGVCGVGINMARLQELFQQYEDRYHIKIDLVNSNMEIQVDTDQDQLQKALSADNFLIQNNEYNFMKYGEHGYVVTKYLENLDWYLVVEHGDLDDSAVSGLIIKNVAALLAFLFILLIIIGILLEREKRKLEKKANLDGLTGLYNKDAFETVVSLQLQKMQGKSAAFLFIDLDHFKEVNDTFGHIAGDELLKEFATKLQQIFTDVSYLGRFGGDEFCVFLRHISEESLALQLDAMLHELSKRYPEKENDVQISASIGVAYVYDATGVEYQELVKLADSALYEAKDAGRNQFVMKKM